MPKLKAPTKATVAQPTNNKSIYHTTCKAIAMLLNGEIDKDTALAASKLIDNSLRAHEVEIKRTRLAFDMGRKDAELRDIEVRGFDTVVDVKKAS